jgi:hypothetical protein
MSHSRIFIAGLMRLPIKDFAALGGDTEPQGGGALRLRHAASHPFCVTLPPPFQAGPRGAGFAAALVRHAPEIARGREQGAAASFGLSV